MAVSSFEFTKKLALPEARRLLWRFGDVLVRVCSRTSWLVGVQVDCSDKAVQLQVKAAGGI
ncbi:hypothetical protein [Hydrogenophaga sp.]|uniref:hypothetical protein n=1 Tax=Hydrogenophaga sp. TaxID=1904254 RepID=UPI00286DFFB5|nr:hypothetical protein [Hydrogenophaga sp.]